MNVSDIAMFTRVGFSVFQRRIVLAMLYQIKTKKKTPISFQFKAREMMEGITPKMTYLQLQHEMQQLNSRLYEVDEPNRLLQVSLLSSTEFVKGRGVFNVEISQAILPFLRHLTQKYPLGCLQYLLGFRSVYAIRLYLLLYKNQGENRFSCTISEFKELMQVGQNYKDYNTFKRRVILQAQKELHLTDMAFYYEEQKAGRRVKGIVFWQQPSSELYLSEERQQWAKKLMQELELSKSQAQRIALQFTKAEIFTNIYKIKEKHRAGTIKTSLAGYAIGYFEKGASSAF